MKSIDNRCNYKDERAMLLYILIITYIINTNNIRDISEDISLSIKYIKNISVFNKNLDNIHNKNIVI